MRTGLLVSVCSLSSGKLQTKRAAQGKVIRDEWNSGCDRPKLWQAHVKLVSTDRKAAKGFARLTRYDILGNGTR